MNDKVSFQKINQILNLVRSLMAKPDPNALPEVDFIVDKFDRSGGMGKYWNYSGAFAPNGAGADIVGGANRTTDTGNYDTSYGGTGILDVIEPLVGYPDAYNGWGVGSSILSAGVATYQARLRGSYTAELEFNVPVNVGTVTVSVCLYLSASGNTVGGMMSAFGSRQGNSAALDVSGNAGIAIEPSYSVSWGVSPSGVVRGAHSLTAQGGSGLVSIATALPSTKLDPSAGLTSFRAYVNGVSPPSQTGHGIKEGGVTTWLDGYHDSDGNYNPTVFD